MHIQQKHKKDSSETFANQPGAKVMATFGCKCEENGKRKTNEGKEIITTYVSKDKYGRYVFALRFLTHTHTIKGRRQRNELPEATSAGLRSHYISRQSRWSRGGGGGGDGSRQAGFTVALLSAGAENFASIVAAREGRRESTVTMETSISLTHTTNPLRTH